MNIQPLDVQRLNVVKNTLFDALMKLETIDGADDVAISIEAAFHDISDTLTIIQLDR